MAMTTFKQRVCYFYDSNIGSYYYGPGHPMKPHRLRMTHSLLLAYGMYKRLEVYQPHPATASEIEQFHTSDYVDFLRRVTPGQEREMAHVMQTFNLGNGTDCPVFDGLYDYCSMYTGGSLSGALKLNHNMTDIAVNWSGGLHHAKKSEASGFCYVNDIVLAILELLKYHSRVLYIDIDIHHGDGVEEAFYLSDRVMTVSFHKFGDFFPGTGDSKDIGLLQGKHHSINVPLQEGIDDKTYLALFKPLMQKVMEVFRPSAVVLQCGADSLTGDRLGCFNLTVKGHGECVKFIKSFNLPTLVLGGGGYNIRNVSRCWAFETSVLLDMPLTNSIPNNDFIQYYGPDYNLHLVPDSALHNANSRESIERIKIRTLQTLSNIEFVPSVQMSQIPPDWYIEQDEQLSSAQEEIESSNARPQDGDAIMNSHIEHRGELYDSDHDQDDRAKMDSEEAKPDVQVNDEVF